MKQTPCQYGAGTVLVRYKLKFGNKGKTRAAKPVDKNRRMGSPPEVFFVRVRQDVPEQRKETCPEGSTTRNLEGTTNGDYVAVLWW